MLPKIPTVEQRAQKLIEKTEPRWTLMIERRREHRLRIWAKGESISRFMIKIMQVHWPGLETRSWQYRIMITVHRRLIQTKSLKVQSQAVGWHPNCRAQHLVACYRPKPSTPEREKRAIGLKFKSTPNWSKSLPKDWLKIVRFTWINNYVKQPLTHSHSARPSIMMINFNRIEGQERNKPWLTPPPDVSMRLGAWEDGWIISLRIYRVHNRPGKAQFKNHPSASLASRTTHQP